MPAWHAQMRPQYCPSLQPSCDKETWVPGAYQVPVSPAVLPNVSSVGWQPPTPGAAITLLAGLVVSDGLLLTIAGRPRTTQERAAVFLRLYAALLPLVTPDEAQLLQIDDWAECVPDLCWRGLISAAPPLTRLTSCLPPCQARGQI
eukprot:COSAG04_NODE_2651_length_3787_cov_2.405471_3_plen_146_part_00